MIMALEHTTKPFYSVQFHPESSKSEYGQQIAANFVDIVREWWRVRDQQPIPIANLVPIIPPIYNNTALHSYPCTSQSNRFDSSVNPSPPESLLQTPTALPSANLPIYKTFIKVFVTKAIEFDSSWNVWLDSPSEHFSIMAPSNCHLNGFPLQEPSMTHSHSSQCNNFPCAHPHLPWTLDFSAHDRKITHYSECRDSPRISGGDFHEYLQQQMETIRWEGVEWIGTRQPDPPFKCGAIGYFGYEMMAEALPQLHVRPNQDAHQPDSSFSFIDRCFIVDHKNNTTLALTMARNEQDATRWFDSLDANKFECKLSAEHHVASSTTSTDSVNLRAHSSTTKYCNDIVLLQQHIRDGNAYELCLTKQWDFEFQSGPSPLMLYKQLRERQPAPYAAYLHLPRHALSILSASPELFLRVTSSGDVLMKPIKGTVSRHEDPIQDLINKDWLIASEKNSAELLMITDLTRNDLTRHCENIHSTPEHVESFPTVHQLMSSVMATLKRDRHPLALIKSIFPPGSMTGAPKIRSCEILQIIETKPRGIYSGILGYIGVDKACCFNVVIRTCVISESPSAFVNSTPNGSMSTSASAADNKSITPEASDVSRAPLIRVRVGAGGAITILSDVEEEVEEMLLKSATILPSLFSTYGNIIRDHST